MPRTRRIWVPGKGAHTISRFVDRRFLLAGPVHRAALLDAITKANERWDWRWLSYALMSSHTHYGHIAGNDAPDRFSGSVNTRFGMAFHRLSDGQTLGPVFADRPKIHAVKNRDLPRLVAYHHRNPDSAGVVERPRDSKWTSHRAYLRLDPAPSFLDVEWALDLLGFEDTAAGRERFDQFVMEVDLDEVPWECANEPSWEPAFRDEPVPVDWNLLTGLARELLGLSAGERLDSRRKAMVRARWLVVRVAVRDLRQAYAAVGAGLGMSRGAVFNLLARRSGEPAWEAASFELRNRYLARTSSR